MLEDVNDILNGEEFFELYSKKELEKITEALKNGKLREDLYYRLNVIPIVIPPLRERNEDVPHLVNSFIKEFSKIYNKKIQDIDDRVLDILTKYYWPGNVRELENVIQRLEESYVRKDKGPLFEALKPFIMSGADTEKQAEIAKSLDMSDAAVRVAVHRLRQRYAALLREVVSDTLGPNEDLETELRELMAAFS